MKINFTSLKALEKRYKKARAQAETWTERAEAFERIAQKKEKSARVACFRIKRANSNL
jgi:hypothetical protein